MSDNGEKDLSKDHLANERTFLAWIRTTLGLMAFGFVLEKFSFFSDQVTKLLGKELTTSPHLIAPSLHRYSFIFGISFIAMGALLSLLSFFKFKITQRQIEEGRYKATTGLDVFLTLIVVLFALFLMVYLILTF